MKRLVRVIGVKGSREDMVSSNFFIIISVIYFWSIILAVNYGKKRYKLFENTNRNDLSKAEGQIYRYVHGRTYLLKLRFHIYSFSYCYLCN